MGCSDTTALPIRFLEQSKVSVGKIYEPKFNAAEFVQLCRNLRSKISVVRVVEHVL